MQTTGTDTTGTTGTTGTGTAGASAGTRRHFGRIDDDETEVWISPRRLADEFAGEAALLETEKFTLIPNFAPRRLFGPLRRLEDLAERRLRGRFGAHFLTVLQKP